MGKTPGKDPLAAVLAAVEFVGPCRFSHWDEEGNPVARQEKNAWVQITAVSMEQTKNTATLLAGLFTKKCIAEHGIDLGKQIIYAYHGQRRIEVTSSSPRAMEGNRPTFVIRNETHHWLASNDGHEMQKVIRRNLGKIKGGQARGMSITNAYHPGEDSVAKHQRLAYMDAAEGRTRFDSTVMYDSLEAPKDATLFPKFTRWDDQGKEVFDLEPDGKSIIPASKEVVREHLRRILDVVRGDAYWLDLERLVEDILDPDMSQEESKRFYFNSVELGDDVSFDPEDISATTDQKLARQRSEHQMTDSLRMGWAKILPTDEIVIFGDGSKSDDSTALVGCRLSDGFIFLVGVWQKPKGDRGRGWLAPRDEIDARVHEAFKRFKIVAFWFDPSHTKDDQDATRYWDVLIDAWHVEFGDRLQYWAVNTGDRRTAIGWDMTSSQRQVDFVQAVERFTDEMESRSLEHDGHPALVEHLTNSRRSMTAAGMSVSKISRSSKKKIDAAVCAIGARMLRRLVMIKGLEEVVKPAKVWW